MCEIGVPIGTPSTGIARTSPKKRIPRGISFEQFTGERDPFELSTSVTRHRSATLGARATSGLRREFILPHSALNTHAGGTEENGTRYGEKSAKQIGGSASLLEESPAARMKARHEREEEISAIDDPREISAAQLLVRRNHQGTWSNTSDSGAEESLVAHFRAGHEHYANGGEEKRHAALLHARLEHHLYISDTSNLQQVRDAPVKTCNVRVNGSESTVGTAQPPQHTPSSDMKMDNSAFALRLSCRPHSFCSAASIVSIDDSHPPPISPTDETDHDCATVLPVVRDAFQGSRHYLPHSDTPVSSHDSMSTSPLVPNTLDNPRSQLPRFGFQSASNPAAVTRHNTGPRSPLSWSDAGGPSKPLPRFGFDEHVVPTALPQIVQTDHHCLFKDGRISPPPGHGIDGHGIPLASLEIIQRDLDGLRKVLPSPKGSASLVASIAMPSQLSLPSTVAAPGLLNSAKSLPRATETQVLTQVPGTPRCIPVDTHSTCAGETLRENAVRSQHADSFPPENLRPAPQILRYGPFQTQQAHQSRNTPLGSGRLQNASKSGIQSSTLDKMPSSCH